ncbi:MAG: T9SS type A sorting domain-containing protein [Bacteroidales bacterium]|nr:T9SS type A sorting domain-containing protein [Bacteroidales bacterium]
MKNLFHRAATICLISTVAIVHAAAQEVVLPLQGNPELQQQDQHPVRKATMEVMLELPLTDDFSYDTPFPDPMIWADDDAFINQNYAVDPPTIGVATLDAVDKNGTVYPFASISPETFVADLLTSHPVNLNYPASDSIYLSFFYQPKGNGLEPYPQDSLCLDFYDPLTEKWFNVWRTPGDTLAAFQQVMIPIDDTLFLKEGFRFGFRNRASLPKNSDYRDKRGNVDHWNIDYVRLGLNRRYNDTIIRDVAFNKPLPSILKRYESVPWNHFEAGYNSLYLPYVTLNYFNNDSATRNVTRNAEIYNEVWDELFRPGNPTTQDILPGTAVSYNLANIYPFEFSRGDTARYNIKAWLRTDEFDNKNNDTISRIQQFRDFFAYDDGTAERAYGLRGQGTSNGLIAVKFESFVADELSGVEVYFTQLKDSLNLNYYFKFMVWNDNDGIPGDLIYEDEYDHAVLYSDILNNFIRFEFKETVNIEGTYYVGLLQYNQYMLNIGLDINKPAMGNLFYNIGSEWLPSSAPGNLMVRPFVKRNFTSVTKDHQEWTSLTVWPNPASDFLRYSLPEERTVGNVRVDIHDITGKQVASHENCSSTIYTGNLPEGLYLFSFSSGQYLLGTERIIIQR